MMIQKQRLLNCKDTKAYSTKNKQKITVQYSAVPPPANKCFKRHNFTEHDEFSCEVLQINTQTPSCVIVNMQQDKENKGLITQKLPKRGGGGGLKTDLQFPWNPF